MRRCLAASLLLMSASVFADTPSITWTVDPLQTEQGSPIKNPDVKGELLFPATSDLTVGTVVLTPVNLPQLTRPIFVIGNDPTSIAWVQKNKVKLKNLHAMGLVTNVSSEQGWEKLESTLGFSLIPVSLDHLNHFLPVEHYPFLLSAGWIEQ